MSTRNDILKHIKSVIASIESIGESRVHVGRILPDRAATQRQVMVWFINDRGGRRDDDKSERELMLVVGVLFKTDPSSDGEEESDLLQASAEYDDVHAKLEDLADFKLGEGDLGAGKNFPNGTVRLMSESDGEHRSGSLGGIEATGFDDRDRAVWIGSVWSVQYERARATE